MRIGYACINTELDCTSNSTFRLKSYSEKRLIETVEKNLNCLKKILKWNKKKNIQFFRIGSKIIPFASHPICKYDWKNRFKKELKEIGNYIKKNKMRVTMHPDQFIIINSNKKDVVERSIKEIKYHAEILDLMKLDSTAKIILHVGGVYNEKEKSIKRFIENYKKLSKSIKKRLIVENDHRSYSVKDCLKINKKIKIPVVVDNLHHKCLNNNENLKDAIKKAKKTWKKKDGNQILHYSNQKENSNKGSHSKTINISNFKNFIKKIKSLNPDIMLEVKDKEQSVLKVQKFLNKT